MYFLRVYRVLSYSSSFVCVFCIFLDYVVFLERTVWSNLSNITTIYIDNFSIVILHTYIQFQYSYLIYICSFFVCISILRLILILCIRVGGCRNVDVIQSKFIRLDTLAQIYKRKKKSKYFSHFVTLQKTKEYHEELFCFHYV